MFRQINLKILEFQSPSEQLVAPNTRVAEFKHSLHGLRQKAHYGPSLLHFAICSMSPLSQESELYSFLHETAEMCHQMHSK